MSHSDFTTLREDGGAAMQESLDQCYPHSSGSAVLSGLRPSQCSCHAVLITVMKSQYTATT